MVEVDGVMQLSLEGGVVPKPQEIRGGWGACEHEESMALDVQLPRAVPLKSANGGGGDLFFMVERGAREI